MFGTNAKNWAAIEGWKVTYHHPGGNYSGQFFTRTPNWLAQNAWLDEGGFSYSTTIVPKGSAIPADKSWSN